MTISAETFIGKSKKNSQDACERLGLIYRLVSVDGENFLGYPTDQRDDRLCVELTGGKVSKASIQ